MRLIHKSALACQATTLAILVRRASRELGDLQFKHAATISNNLGGDPNLILQCYGYGVTTRPFLSVLRLGGIQIPDFVTIHRTIIVPIFNEHGEHVGLHDQFGRWIIQTTSPHVVNPGAAFHSPVEIRNTTPEADSLALERGCCVVVAHGCPTLDLISRLSSLRRVAAA